MDNDDIIRKLVELYERMNEEQRLQAFELVLELLKKYESHNTSEPD